jgi:hypothetical protein
MFKEERDYSKFQWSDLGDIEMGRPSLGQMVPVVAYRLMQYTLREALIMRVGTEKTNQVFFDAGKLAGIQLCRNLLNTKLPFNDFIASLQEKLRELKIGIVRIEHTDLEKLEFTLTVEEDLDCSGLPISDETICVYDEGFVAGILKEYTGKDFKVKEVDCWATGDRCCRFDIKR